MRVALWLRRGSRVKSSWDGPHRTATCAGHSQRCAPKSYVMTFIKKHALAIVFAAGLSQAVAPAQSPLPKAESSVTRNPAVVREWANRLLANDPKVRATAEGALVQGARSSLPLL